MQRRLTMQIFYRQMLWSSQLIACNGWQLINLIASMYEYPKEILIFGRNINQPLTTANIEEVILSSILLTIVSWKKYTQLCRFTSGFGTSVDQSSDEV